MVRRPLKFLFIYIFYLLGLLEFSAFAVHFLLKDKIVFTSNFIPKHLVGAQYDQQLGWTAVEDRTRDTGNQFLNCFGDSFTFGDEVQESESWPAVLETFLKRNVANFGVPAYGTDQALLMAEKKLTGAGRFFLLSFISDDLARNLNIYRPFYFPSSGIFYTKPRFKKIDNTFLFVENPVKSRNELEKLRDPAFLKKIGELDYWYNLNDTPKSHFPFSRFYFNSFFWSQLKTFLITGNKLRGSYYSQKIQNEPEALETQNYIVERFFKKVREAGKTPILMHLPTRLEIDEYRERDIIAPIVQHTKLFCIKNQYTCYFPLIEEAKLRKISSDTLFGKHDHYSAAGNLIIAEFVKNKLSEFKTP